jgi:hypothetical protein
VHDVGLGVVLELLAGGEGRAALVTVLVAEGDELAADELPALARAGEQRLDLLQALLLLGALGADLLDLEPGELVEADLGWHRLDLIEPKASSGPRGVGREVADDADGTIEVVVDLGESVQDVEAVLQLAALVLEPPRHHRHAVVEEVPAEVVERDARRLADGRVGGRRETREVDVEVGLQAGVLV